MNSPAKADEGSRLRKRITKAVESHGWKVVRLDYTRPVAVGKVTEDFSWLEGGWELEVLPADEWTPDAKAGKLIISSGRTSPAARRTSTCFASRSAIYCYATSVGR